jgi:hypothetical protein
LTRLLRREPVASFSVFALPPLSSLLLLIAFAGCATMTPPASPKAPVPEWESAKLIESLKQRMERFRSVRALAQVDYAGPEGRHGFQEAVIVQRPNRLRLDTLTFLGAILIFTANENQVIGYHPREGVYVRGRPTKENLRRYTQIPLELEEVTKLLTGLPPVDAGASWKQDGNMLSAPSSGRGRDVLSFASHEPVPSKWERFNNDGNLELSAQFLDYTSTPAGLFPLSLILEAHGQKRKMTLRYKEPEVNPDIPPEQFTQQIPAHFKEVPIEAVGD